MREGVGWRSEAGFTPYEISAADPAIPRACALWLHRFFVKFNVDAMLINHPDKIFVFYWGLFFLWISNMARSFILEPKDILEYLIGHRHGCRSKFTRQSSAVDYRGSTITLKHAPTGIEVKGDVPMGHYSNKQIKALEIKLCEQLKVELTKAVARHLHIPGL